MSTLHELLSLQSESGNCVAVYNWLVDLGTSLGWDMAVDKEGNLYITKGKSKTYPCVAAHMDTIHSITKGGIHPVEVRGYVTGINPETMEQTGIGGDDKCGVWAAVQCLQNLDCCKAVFFVDEEVGCRGSSKCHLEFFKDCRFVLQADRRGHEDFITDISGPLSSDAFQEAVMPLLIEHGYDFQYGAMTDVMELRDREVGISVANMSAGYYSPHSDQEFIGIKELSTACLLMQGICKTLTDVYPFVAPKKKRSWYGFGRAYRDHGSLDAEYFSHSRRDAEINYSALQTNGQTMGEMFPDYEPYGYDPSGEYLAKSRPWWQTGNEVCRGCGDVIMSDDLVSDTDEPMCMDCAVQLYHEGNISGRVSNVARQARIDAEEEKSSRWREPSRSLRKSRRRAERERRRFERKLKASTATNPAK